MVVVVCGCECVVWVGGGDGGEAQACEYLGFNVWDIPAGAQPRRPWRGGAKVTR